MAYTPKMFYRASCTLRRIAWALNMPMTKAMETIFNYLPIILDSDKICQKCRDKTRGHECSFNRNKQKEVKHEQEINNIRKRL